MVAPFVIIIILGILGQKSRAVYLDRVAEEDSDDQFERGTGDDSDEVIDQEAEFEIGKIDAAGVTLLSNLTAVVQFGYDQGMKDKLASVGSDDFSAWITAVAAHTQAFYNHASLGTRITLEVC